MVAHPYDARLAMSAGYDGLTLVWDICKGVLLHRCATYPHMTAAPLSDCRLRSRWPVQALRPGAWMVVVRCLVCKCSSGGLCCTVLIHKRSTTLSPWSDGITPIAPKERNVLMLCRLCICGLWPQLQHPGRVPHVSVGACWPVVRLPAAGGWLLGA